MDFIKVSGKTVEDALTEAKIQLGVTSDELEYEIIEKGSNGFLGIGSKDAVINARVKVKEDKPVEEIKEEIQEEIKEEPAKKVKEVKVTENLSTDEVIAKVNKFLDDVFKAMNLEVEVVTKVDEAEKIIDVELKGAEMGVLIGKRGQTLDSLQYLTNLAINKHSDSYYKVKVDTEDYRKRRKETLENLAKNIAYKVKKTRKPVVLEPMNPFERRVIHSALQNDKYVTTHSEGEEPFRHVVVTLKK